NLSAEATGGGILLLPSTYADAKQIDMKPYVVDAETIKLIDDSVNEYFGVNEAILKSEAVGDAWSAFYESIIEPFAIQFSEVMSDMIFTPREQASGSKVIATSNRLQYMSNQDKLNVTQQLVDGGIMTINDALEVWQLPPIEGGDVRVIRGEYVNFNERTSTNENV
ncbi:MAG: phage portal protein, partial [Lachnospiraceae bacterium]|nr:phage portal protein [Lachnospiraceae bacterium]